MRFRQWSSLIVAIVVLAAVLDGQAARVEAATTSQVVTLSWEEAVRGPVPLTVGLGYIGLIRIRSVPIVSATDSPPGIVHVVARGDAALVVPVTVGQTSVTIRLGAEVATFLVTVTPNAAGAVVVEMSGPVRAAVGPRAGTAVPVPPPNGPTPSTGPRTGQAAPADPPTAPPRQPIPGASTPGGGAERGGGGRGVVVTAPPPVAVTAVARKSVGVLSVGYVIGNNSAGALELDPHSIRVRDASGTVLVHQIDIDTPGVIPPGAVEAGLIVIPSPRDQVTITLGLREHDGTALPVTIAVDATALSSSPSGTGGGQASQPQRREAPPVERVTVLLPTPAAGTTAPPPAHPPQGATPASSDGQGIPESASAGQPAAGTSRAPLSPPQPVRVTIADPTAQQMLTVTAAAEGQTITVRYSIHNVSSTPLASRGIVVTDARGKEIPLRGTEAAPLAPIAGGQTVQGVLHIPFVAFPATIRWQWWGLFRTLWATAATLST